MIYSLAVGKVHVYKTLANIPAAPRQNIAMSPPLFFWEEKNTLCSCFTDVKHDGFYLSRLRVPSVSKCLFVQPV